MPSPRLIVALSAVALALPVAGCGSSDEGLLTARQANKLEDKVNAADQAVDDNKCGVARAAAQAGAEQVSSINKLDTELRNNLVEGFNHLNDRVNAECGKAEEEETPTPTPTPTPTEEPTEVPTEAPTEEPTPTVTEEPTEVPTEVPTEEATLPPTETPEDTGGTEG